MPRKPLKQKILTVPEVKKLLETGNIDELARMYKLYSLENAIELLHFMAELIGNCIKDEGINVNQRFTAENTCDFKYYIEQLIIYMINMKIYMKTIKWRRLKY